MLKEKAALAIALGDLPSVDVANFYGGFGHGEQCPLCKRVIDSNELSAEVELRARILVMHSACYHAWQRAVEERRQARLADTDTYEVEATPVA